LRFIELTILSNQAVQIDFAAFIQNLPLQLSFMKGGACGTEISSAICPFLQKRISLRVCAL
jgi:hypothetical protein